MSFLSSYWIPKGSEQDFQQDSQGLPFTVLFRSPRCCSVQSNPLKWFVVSFLKPFRGLCHLYLSFVSIYHYVFITIHHSHLKISPEFSASYALSSPRFGSDLDFIYPLDASGNSAWRLTPDEPEPTETPEQLFFNRAKVNMISWIQLMISMCKT